MANRLTETDRGRYWPLGSVIMIITAIACITYQLPTAFDQQLYVAADVFNGIKIAPSHFPIAH